MSVYSVLQSIGLPCAYSHFREDVAPPYLVYTGAGQDNFEADNTYRYSRNLYQVEYYFVTKDETQEASIESALLNAGFLYQKSEDVFIEEEGVFVIYYTI